MKVGTAAWLSLVEVHRYYSVVSNDPEESSLLVPHPTPDAGAYGGRHRNRLALSGVRHIPIAAQSRPRAAGLTPEMLLSKRFHKIFWDAYVSRDVPITPLLRAKAVVRLVPSGSYISHHTAAELWGAAVPADTATHVTLPSAHRRQVRQGGAPTIAGTRAPTVLRKGVPISTPTQTFLDLAAVRIGLVDLVVVADGMIKAGHTSPEQLIEAAAQWSGQGCRMARIAASLAREGVDSRRKRGYSSFLCLLVFPSLASI